MNTRVGMLRLAMCLVAGFWLIVARTSMDLAADLPNRLSGAAVTMFIAAALAVVSLMLAVAPVGWWRFAIQFPRQSFDRLNRTDSPTDACIGRPLMFCALAAFLANVCCFLPLQRNPWDDDQGAYLTRAAEIHSAGGMPHLAQALVSGEFEEANRHPLFLALLSMRPEFEFGKLMSSAMGVFTLLLSALLVARRNGATVAGVFAALLSVNFAFCFFSTRVVSEILVVLFSSAVWLMTSRCSGEGLLDSVTGNPRSTSRIVIRFTGIGALLGLAWLSKATGLLLLIGYLTWLVLEWAWQRRRSRAAEATESTSWKRWVVAVTCVCCAFLAVGSPLLVRNLRRFGNPFHNVNSLLLFADEYEQFDEMVEANTTTSASAREYLATHSIAEIAGRELSGLVWELFIILRSLGPTPLEDSRLLLGGPLAVLAAATMAARWRPEHRLLLVWGLLHWVVFAWYVPIAAGERFVLPLLIPILVASSEGLVQLWPWSKPWARRSFALSGIAWLVVWALATYGLAGDPM